jgi:hypothetical protein
MWVSKVSEFEDNDVGLGLAEVLARCSLGDRCCSINISTTNALSCAFYQNTQI